MAAPRRLEDGLDDGLNAIAEDVRQKTALRYIVATAFGILTCFCLPPPEGVAWLALAILSELILSWSTRRSVAQRATPQVNRRTKLCATFFSSGVWTSGAVLYWLVGVPAFQVAAVILLATLLIIAQGDSFRSLSSAATFGVAPALAITTLPLFASTYGDLERVCVAVVTFLALAFLAGNFRQNVANSAALRAYQAALVQKSHQADAANRAKTSFLAVMSHELRTPMNGVLGMTRALGQTDLAPRQAEYVGMLTKSGEDLMTILNELLDISKIEAGKLELETITFDFLELVERVHGFWSAAAGDKGVHLAVQVEDSTPRWLIGDPTRLRQVLNNLVSNALKFTSHGEVRLSVSVLAMEPSSAELEIIVSDTGIGMDAEQQSRLFQSFSQADASTTRRFGGTGLGLAICKQLVGLMAGDIEVESAAGKGTAFRVHLRLPIGESSATAAEAAREVTGAIDLRALVADDNAINQVVARSILEPLGIQVTTANDGAEALDRLKSDRFDVVLMDVHMPNMDGIEALARIRGGEARDPTIPVIALTADALSGADEALLAQGFDAVEPKPVNPGRLLLSIMRVCSAASAGDADDPLRVSG